MTNVRTSIVLLVLILCAAPARAQDDDALRLLLTRVERVVRAADGPGYLALLTAGANRSRAIEFVSSVPAQAFAGSEDKVITLPRPSGDPRVFAGEVYLKHFALPNFFFHCTMAYALLRQSGAEIGKMDFLGAA